MRFKKFIGFYGKLNEALVCQGHYLDACALRNAVAVTGDVRTHFAFRFHADAHAGCMQISCKCAGIMHAYFTRAAKFIVLFFQGNVHTQFACSFLLDAHARCMQISSAVRNSEAFTGDVRTHFACRFFADAHVNPMPAFGARSMKLDACSACTRGPELEA